jgi:hypothetical protein
MKVILRDKTTGRFYSPRGAWVLDARDAFDFQDVNRAEMFANVERLCHAEVIRHEPQEVDDAE